MPVTPNPAQNLKIGDFAKLAGTNLRTLRYYEELGLLRPVTRSAGGFRQYRPADLYRVQLIQNLQELGLQLDEIGELIQCSPGTGCGDDSSTGRRQWMAKVQAALERQESLISERIAMLDKQRRDVSSARTKLAECAPCVHTPSEKNDFCTPCHMSGEQLPALLNALFR
jgi:MerR family mercuric resistance operon transcriptional regulator